MSDILLNLQDSLRVTERISCIEVPGSVEGVGWSVVDALGGIGNVSEALWNPKDVSLVLRLKPMDAYSKFLPARVVTAAGLLMKVQKRRSGRRSYSLEGVIDNDYRFEALVDYVLSPPDICRFPRDLVKDLEDLRQKQFESDIRGPLCDFLPPPIYTRQFHPYPYKFTDNLFLNTAKYFLYKDGAAPLQTPQDPFNSGFLLNGQNEDSKESESFHPLQRGSSGPCNLVMKFEGANLPTPGLSRPMKIAASDPQLLEEINRLLETRPLWQRVALLSHLPSTVTFWKLKPVLARSCFLFLDGPWRGLLCRFGYDPRKDPEARFYQNIDFRDPYFRSLRWRTKQGSIALPSSARPSDPSIDNTVVSASRAARGPTPRQATIFNTDWKFREPPQRPSQFYQLCDIDDLVIQELIKKAAPTSTCSKTTGWFTPETYGRIKDLLCAKSRILRERMDM